MLGILDSYAFGFSVKVVLLVCDYVFFQVESFYIYSYCYLEFMVATGIWGYWNKLESHQLSARG